MYLSESNFVFLTLRKIVQQTLRINISNCIMLYSYERSRVLQERKEVIVDGGQIFYSISGGLTIHTIFVVFCSL